MNPHHNARKGVLPPHLIKGETEVEACVMQPGQDMEDSDSSKNSVPPSPMFCPLQSTVQMTRVCATLVTQNPVLFRPLGYPDCSVL